MATSGRRGGRRHGGEGGARYGGEEDDRGRDGREPEPYHHEPEPEHGGEPYDDPGEHLEIERRRFAGGLAATPERYALAREQWYRLPGVVLRPSMDTAVGDPAADEAPPAGQADPDRKGPGQ
jgi:hypothetical protein